MDTSHEIPLKDYEKGERYAEEEVTFLKERWLVQEMSDVAAWMLNGAPQTSKPECVDVTCQFASVPAYDLRGIDLSGRLQPGSAAYRGNTLLMRARFEHAKLTGVFLRNYDFAFAHFSGAEMFGVHMQAVRFRSACFIDADLRSAHLEGASLREADFRGARLNGVHLAGAVLTQANICGANLSGAYLKETIFRDVIWRSPKGRCPDSNCFMNFDVHGLRYSDPLFDEFARQSEFIRRCKETMPKTLFWLWEKTCDCGRSLWRLIVSCVVLIAFFALLFYVPALCGTCIVRPVSGGNSAELGGSFLTYLYFSVVTFSTLGFGDVTPCNAAGQIAVMAEVLLGYVALGALISVFSMKILPPR